MNKREGGSIACLNPCCNGRCSLTGFEEFSDEAILCLNPCCNGRCSLTAVIACSKRVSAGVLILVVMEDAL